MDLLTSLIREKEPSFTGTFESLLNTKSKIEVKSLIGNRAAESAIVLTALESVLGKKKFASIVTEAADSLDTYDVADKGASIDTAKQAASDASDEADAKSTTETMTSLKLAENANDPLYNDYLETSTKLADIMSQIDEKYKNDSAKEAFIILKNARKKCTFISSAAGREINTALESIIAAY